MKKIKFLLTILIILFVLTFSINCYATDIEHNGETISFNYDIPAFPINNSTYGDFSKYAALYDIESETYYLFCILENVNNIFTICKLDMDTSKCVISQLIEKTNNPGEYEPGSPQKVCIYTFNKNDTSWNFNKYDSRIPISSNVIYLYKDNCFNITFIDSGISQLSTSVYNIGLTTEGYTYIDNSNNNNNSNQNNNSNISQDIASALSSVSEQINTMINIRIISTVVGLVLTLAAGLFLTWFGIRKIISGIKNALKGKLSI